MTGSRRPRRNDSGLSLVELTIYVVILGLLSIILSSVIISLSRSQQAVNDVTTGSNDAQVFASMIDRDIRNARAAGCAFVATGPDPCSQPSTQQLALEVQRDSAGEVCVERVTWRFEGGNLLRIGAAGDQFMFEKASGSFAVTGRTIDFEYKHSSQLVDQENYSGSATLAPANLEGDEC